MSLRFGSSKGLMSEYCDSKDWGEAGLFPPGSRCDCGAGVGDATADLELFREMALLESGTSCKRNPSCAVCWRSFPRACGGLLLLVLSGRSVNCELTGEPVADLFTGVLISEESFFRLRPFS
jgi:hypothetical protein